MPKAARTPITKTPITTQPLRALTEFTTLPPGHMTFRIEEDGCEPHLKEGEYAVIDMTDRSVQNGELFLIQYQSGNRARPIVQVKSAMSQITPFPSPKQVVWWCCSLRGFRPLHIPPAGSAGIPECREPGEKIAGPCRRLFNAAAQQGSLSSCGL